MSRYWNNYVLMPTRDECEGIPESECKMSCPDMEGFFSDTITDADFEHLQSWQYLLVYLSADMRKELHGLAPDKKFLVLSHLCTDTTLLGDMLTSNSPLDVSFFHVHAEVERIFQRKALSGTFKDVSWPGCGKDNCPGWCPGYKLKWFDYVFDGIHPTSEASQVESEYEYSRNVRNDEFLAHLTPSTEHYARMIPYVYDEFVWRGCDIPKKYKSYVDQSLMNASQWIKPKDLEWLKQAAA